ncbi:MAG: amino acid racemase [Oscillospiraceae bacterium]|nr:amino acid racemase [Oscillospiraceae bacterium]
MADEKILGVLGGIGPLATVYFMELLVNLTDAASDQGHISCLVYNHASIPDRTDYIMDSAKPNPLPVMIADAQLLERSGAETIVIPCNTAHYFYEQIQKNVSIPIINIIEETVKYAHGHVPNLRTLGILATKGTITAGSYQKVCEKYGIHCAVPSLFDEQALMHIIYNQVKAGQSVDYKEFLRIVDSMLNEGCDAVILGCTELSVIHRDLNMDRPDVIDSMEVLAKVSIISCGKTVRTTHSQLT